MTAAATLSPVQHNTSDSFIRTRALAAARPCSLHGCTLPAFSTEGGTIAWLQWLLQSVSAGSYDGSSTMTKEPMLLSLEAAQCHQHPKTRFVCQNFKETGSIRLLSTSPGTSCSSGYHMPSRSILLSCDSCHGGHSHSTGMDTNMSIHTCTHTHHACRDPSALGYRTNAAVSSPRTSLPAVSRAILAKSHESAEGGSSSPTSSPSSPAPSPSSSSSPSSPSGRSSDAKKSTNKAYVGAGVSTSAFLYSTSQEFGQIWSQTTAFLHRTFSPTYRVGSLYIESWTNGTQRRGLERLKANVLRGDAFVLVRNMTRQLKDVWRRSLAEALEMDRRSKTIEDKQKPHQKQGPQDPSSGSGSGSTRPSAPSSTSNSINNNSGQSGNNGAGKEGGNNRPSNAAGNSKSPSS